MRQRMAFLDAWRSLAILCMLVYHFLYDLALFGRMPWTALFSPGLHLFQQFTCWSFILLAGISSRFSRSNTRRGLVTLGASVIISLGSGVVGQSIQFGVLHFLGCAMLLYAFVGKQLQRMPDAVLPLLCSGLFVVTKLWTEAVVVETKFLFPLGFRYPGFQSADYFPLMPWFFLFLLGTWLGGWIRARDWKWLAKPLPAALTWPGRHSLLIYLLHQPVLYALAWLLA